MPTTDDYAKDSGKEVFTKLNCILITNPFNHSTGIRLRNVIHLGEKLLAAIFSVMVYNDGRSEATQSKTQLNLSYKNEYKNVKKCSLIQGSFVVWLKALSLSRIKVYLFIFIP